MEKALKIIGSGGLAKEIIGYIVNEKPLRYRIEGCWSDKKFNNDDYSYLYKGNLEMFQQTFSEGEFVIIAIADPKVREKLVEKFSHLAIVYESYIHPSCEISPFSVINQGAILCPGTMVVGDAFLDSFVFANTGVVVGHDSSVGSFSCLFPKVEVCGDCDIGKGSVLGINSVVLPGNRLIAGSKLDAFSILRRSYTFSGIFSGNPARPVKRFD